MVDFIHKSQQNLKSNSLSARPKPVVNEMPQILPKLVAKLNLPENQRDALKTARFQFSETSRSIANERVKVLNKLKMVNSVSKILCTNYLQKRKATRKP